MPDAADPRTSLAANPTPHSSPPDVTWRLARAWPDAELVLVEEEGHGLSGDAMTEAVGAATERFAGG